MKKKLFSILILPAVLLSSCSWFGVASSEKVIVVFKKPSVRVLLMEKVLFLI